jgi:polyisoprenoid-binding protein YceI
MHLRIIIFIFVVLASPRRASAEVGLELPLNINDRNTIVRFQVDSTWHLIHGEVSGIHGTIENGMFADYRDIHGEVDFPVDTFDTGNSLRDRRLREIMDASAYPSAKFMLHGIQKLCVPQDGGQIDCPILLRGALTIRGVTQPISLTGTVTKAKDSWSTRGTTSFHWADFGIKDPSILIARLNPEVLVEFKVTIPLRKVLEK